MILRLLIPVLILLSAHPAAAFESAESLQKLRGVMTDRLVIMEQIAKSKWNAGRPVEDADREAEVLELVTGLAVSEGLDPAHAARVAGAQIEAAKMVQSALFVEWGAASVGKHANVPNITAALRPEVSRLTRELIAAVGATHEDLKDCRALRVLSPVPEALDRHQRAWAVAVNGVLAATGPCPQGEEGH